jgi:hypothetical protein
MDALSPKKRGRKKIQRDPLAQDVAALEKQNERLRGKLKQAGSIIEVRKNMGDAGDLLGLRRKEQLMNVVGTLSPHGTLFHSGQFRKFTRPQPDP